MPPMHHDRPRSPRFPVRWGWLAFVSAAHAAGLMVLSGYLDGDSPRGETVVTVPTIAVRLIAPSVGEQPPPSPPAPRPERVIPPSNTNVTKSPAPARAPAPNGPPAALAPAPHAVTPTTDAAPPPPARIEPLSPGPASPPQVIASPAATTTHASSSAAGTEPSIKEARFDAAYLNNPAPDYPRLSRRRGEEGRVLLRVRVLADGRPDSVEIQGSSGHPRLDDAARDTVRSWRFVPARRGDVAIDSWLGVPIVFRLED